jgi:hypothetical protein
VLSVRYAERSRPPLGRRRAGRRFSSTCFPSAIAFSFTRPARSSARRFDLDCPRSSTPAHMP